MQISRLLTGRREDKMSVDITQFIEPPEEYVQASAFADQMLQLHLLGDCAVRACLDAIRLAPSPSIALREWLRGYGDYQYGREQSQGEYYDKGYGFSYVFAEQMQAQAPCPIHWLQEDELDV